MFVYECLKLDSWLSRCSNRVQVYIIILLIVKAIIDVNSFYRKMHRLGVLTRRLRSFDAYELTMDLPKIASK